ncbi:MAG TPA: MOSC N-terminal beta barrel domain-containing protein [Polyangiaceae bacterium]
MHVASLHRYPVKSCRGEAVAELALDRHGPIGDRCFMIIDAEGRFVTQREHHRLALVTPEVGARTLSLTAPGMSRLEIPLDAARPSRDFTVWRFSGAGADLGLEAEAWLTALLQSPVRLVEWRDAEFRAANPAHAPEGSSAGRFTDGYPVLLATEASLADLNRRMAKPLPMTRFRPNVVVAGAEPWAEDGWRALRIGGVELRVAKPCERCVITTIDQETGVASKEPLATLATFRKRDGAVHFAVNLVHVAPGTLRAGDPVEVLG